MDGQPDQRAVLETCARECAQRGWRLAYALLQHSEDAADCVHQAFMVALRKPQRVPIDDAWPWLAGVIAHEARNVRRKRARHQTVSLQAGADMPLEHRSADPAQAAQDRERDEQLVAALNELPEPEREALMMTQMAGLTYAVAAQSLHVPLGTLNRRVSRGLANLRRRLGRGEAAIMGCIPLLPMAPPPAGLQETLLMQAAGTGAAIPAGILIAGVAMKKTLVAAALVLLVLLVGIGAFSVVGWPWLEGPTSDQSATNPGAQGTALVGKQTGTNSPAEREGGTGTADNSLSTDNSTTDSGANSDAALGGSVQVTVKDELTSRPVAGASLTPDGKGATATTDETGKAELAHAVFAKGVTARAEGYVESKVAAPQATTESITVMLAPAHQGSGKVLNESGAPAVGARVLLGSRRTPVASATCGGAFETRAGADGSFTFPVSNRERDAMATLPDNFHGAELVLPGQRELTLRLGPARGIDVFLEGPGTAGIKTLMLQQAPWPADSATVTNGRAQFRSIGPTAIIMLTSPDRPDAWWDVGLDRRAAITPYFIYLDDATITLRVRWRSTPTRPIASVHVGAGGKSPTAPTGKVVSQDTFILPYHLAPLYSTAIRFLDAEGKIAGFASGISFKSVSDTEWECEADATHLVGGRVVDAKGKPVPGCTVRTLTLGISAFRNGETVTGLDGRFEVNIDNRHEVRLSATDGANFADLTFGPNCKSFADVVLSPRRTIRVQLKGAKSDEQFFVYASDLGREAGPAPLLGRAGEFVDVPVTVHTLSINADGPTALHVKRVNAEDRDALIDLDAGRFTVHLYAFEEDVQTKNRRPLAARRLRIRSGLPEPKKPSWPMKPEDSPFVQTAAVRIVTTDESGRATVAGIQPGRLTIQEVSESSIGGNNSFEVTTDGQQVEYCVRTWADERQSNYVPVIGRIQPATSRQYLRITSLSAPLSKPMDGRAIRDRGIKSAAVENTQFQGSGYSARVDPNFPYLAVMISDESEVWGNAGYLTQAGDVWRADLVLPSLEDREASAKLLVTDGGHGATSLQLKIVWTEDGKLRGRGAQVELGKECEISWPESARDVRLFLTAEAGERRLAAMVSPRADTVNRATLQAMPPVKLTNTTGLTGQLSLTPPGINEHEWRNVQSLAKNASNLRLFGSGQYELAGKDAAGTVRTKTISVVIRDDTAVIEIDPRPVLQPKEE